MKRLQTNEARPNQAQEEQQAQQLREQQELQRLLLPRRLSEQVKTAAQKARVSVAAAAAAQAAAAREEQHKLLRQVGVYLLKSDYAIVDSVVVLTKFPPFWFVYVFVTPCCCDSSVFLPFPSSLPVPVAPWRRSRNCNKAPKVRKSRS